MNDVISDVIPKFYREVEYNGDCILSWYFYVTTAHPTFLNLSDIYKCHRFWCNNKEKHVVCAAELGGVQSPQSSSNSITDKNPKCRVHPTDTTFSQNGGQMLAGQFGLFPFPKVPLAISMLSRRKTSPQVPHTGDVPLWVCLLVDRVGPFGSRSDFHSCNC